MYGVIRILLMGVQLAERHGTLLVQIPHETLVM
jgi:hypothetical protein